LTTDVLVCGGSFAGVAAALAAARAGRRVLLLERRTYLGAEVSAYLRPWLTPSQLDVLCSLLGPTLSAAAGPLQEPGPALAAAAVPLQEPGPVQAELPLIPDRLKTALEDVLLEAGVTLLYAVRPVGIRTGRPLQVEAVGKAGRMTIAAGAVIDATEQAVLARLCCPASARTAQAGARLWRTLELTGVDTAGARPAGDPRAGGVSIPEKLTPAWRLHAGYARDLGHVLLEYAMDVPAAGEPGWQQDAEQRARWIGADLCRWMRENHPAFSGMRLASTSHELAVPPLWRVEPDPGQRLFVASACTDLPDDEAARLYLDPAALTRLGLSVGTQVADLATSPGPALSAARSAAATPSAGVTPPAVAAPSVVAAASPVASPAAVATPSPVAAPSAVVAPPRVASPATVVAASADATAAAVATPSAGPTSSATAVPCAATTPPPSHDRPAEAPLRTLPVIRRTVDVLVIGGGTSGAAAAVGAARHGAVTLVADMNPAPGGTGTLGGVDSYWFGRRTGFNQEVSARVAEQHDQTGCQGNKWNTEAKALAWLDLLRGAGAELLLNTVLMDVLADRQPGPRRVTGARLAAPDCLVEVTARVTVDATGDGDAAVLAGAEAVYGSDREGATMWYSLAPQPRPGVFQNNFTSAVDVGDPFDYTRAILSGRRRMPGHDHGPYVAPRESRHVLGDVRLTLTDILTLRRWPDVISLHFSNHDIKGHNTSDWLRLGLLPPNLEIEIPYRALLPVGVEGLLVTGKAISATHDALPPIRMQADLENLGYATGTAAALAARSGVALRALPVHELQATLVAEGLLPASLAARELEADRPPTTEEMQGWIDSLNDAEPLFLCGEMEMDEVRRTPIPFVQICTAGPAVVPLLRAALERPDHPGRLHIARALAWYGDQAATPVLLEAIAPHLAGDVLPPRTVHIRYTQASPDHGAMPELAYLLHALAMVRDRRAIPVLMRVVERIHPTEERFRDPMSGVFHYVDAACDIAERLGDPQCVPALRRLHQEPLFHNRVTTAPVTPDFFAERAAFLELTICRALARCGAPEGLEVLVQYLCDSRRPLVRHAHQELVRLSGRALPPDPDVWRGWLALVRHWRPRPWCPPRG